jgi:hypothetical protein
MRAWAFPLAVTGLIAVACSQPPGGGTTPTGTVIQSQALTDIAKGANSRITQVRRVSVKDDATWQALWREHAGSDQNRPPVDFAKEMVLGAFAGERLTAGYVVTIQSLEPRGSQLLVHVREASPGPGEVTAQVLTQPFHLVRTPKRDEAIVFIEAPGVPSLP